MNLKKLPLENLRRNSGRTIGLTALVALLACVLFGGSVVIASLQNGLSSLQNRLGADVIVAPATAKSQVDLHEVLVEGVPDQFYMDASILDAIAQRPDISTVSPQYYLATLKAGCCTMPVQVIGFDPASDFSVQPWIQRSYEGELKRDQVVTGCNITGAPGTIITLYGIECAIASKLEKTGTKLDNAVFATNETLRHLISEAIARGFPPDTYEDPSTRISTVQVKVRDGSNAELVADDINLHVRGVKAVAARAMTSSVSESVSGIAGTIAALMAVIWALTAAVLVIVFTLASRHRAREFAVLRVIGASRKALSALVLKEAFLISILGSLIGLGIALIIIFAVSDSLESALGVPFLTPGTGSLALFAGATITITLCAGCITSAFSAHRLSRVDAGKVLREE